MDDLEKSPVDRVVLAWLVLPRKKRSSADIAKAIKPILGGSVDDAQKVVSDTLARLKTRGMIERDTRLMLTEEGRRAALAALGYTDLPKRTKVDWRWAKKALVLRAIGLQPGHRSTAAGLVKSIVISHHRLSLGNDPKPMKILAALAWRAIGQDAKDSFTLDNLFGPFLLRGAQPAPTDTTPAVTPPAKPPVADDLPGFAANVRGAAQATPTGRWHDNKVFISHVWDELRRRGADGRMTFGDFKSRLIEANRAQLIELSRADLVQAMPPEDVAASETPYLNATFHFVRLDDR